MKPVTTRVKVGRFPEGSPVLTRTINTFARLSGIQIDGVIDHQYPQVFSSSTGRIILK